MVQNLWQLALGFILLAIGATFLVIVPDMIVSTVSQSGVVDATVATEAQQKSATIKNIGLALITIGAVLLIIPFVRGAFGA